MTSCTDIGFAENVVPQRSVTLPLRGGDPNLLGIQRGDSNVTRHGFARWQPDTLSSLQVTDGERVVILNLALAGDSYWQLNECSHQLPVDFLRPLRRCHTWCIEEQCPIDRPFMRYRTESQQIRKERHRIRLQVQLVAVPDLRMAVPIGCVGKLERYECAVLRAKPPRAVPKHLLYKRIPDERRQKLVQNDPLIMPPQLRRRFVERAVVRYAAAPTFIYNGVVSLEHGEMQLRHQHVRIVAWVSDNGHALSISLHICFVRPQ